MANGKGTTGLVLTCLASGLLLPANGADKKQRVHVPVAVVQTSLGRIAFRLLKEESPRSVQRFEELVRAGYYDGSIISRVLPGLLIQAGALEDDTGSGPQSRADYKPPDIESRILKHHCGSVSMARESEDPRGRCEFFICLQTVSYYDGKYSVIGEVISGIEVAKAISDVPRNTRAVPLFPVHIQKVSIEMQDLFVEK